MGIENIRIIQKGQITGQTPNQNSFQKYNVFTEKPGFMFISDLYNKDWKAFVDDKETEIFRTNWTLRSIFVPEGQHVVEFRYEPLFFKIGLWLSIISILFIIIISFFKIIHKNTRKPTFIN